MHELGSLEEFIEFIRRNQGISAKLEIEPTSLLGKDLRIIGDDGDDLLEAIQQRYGVSFVGSDGTIRQAFGLRPGQFLFKSEPNVIQLISELFGGDPESNVKPLTVGELYEVTCKMRDAAASSPAGRAPGRGDPSGNA